MKMLLWIAQIALATLGISGGAYKIFQFEVLQKDLASVQALPKELWIFLGAFEVLGGVGLLVPALCRNAAVAMAVESVLISAIYVAYGDFPPVAFTVVMAALAGFIAYGRTALAPFK